MTTLFINWVCLAQEDVLQSARTRCAANGLIQAPLWRQILVKGTPSALFLELTSVSEEPVAQGTETSAGRDAIRAGFAWADLEDSEFVCKMLAHEQFAVGTTVLRALDAIKRNKTSLLKKLTDRQAQAARLRSASQQ